VEIPYKRKREVRDTQTETADITENKVETKTPATHRGETVVQQDKKLSQIMFLGAFPL